MCSQYTLFTTGPKILGHYSIALAPDNFPEQINEKVLPHKEAWIVVKDKAHTALSRMRFSLLPSWSKEPRLKFSTHNARIETVKEKATWRTPFARSHCIVPISHFVEPIYQNRFAGNMVRFFPADGSILSAAGIYDVWKSPDKKEEVHSFAILTCESDGVVKREGHERTPIFLKDSLSLEWLESDKDNSRDWREFLLKNRVTPELECSIDRPLKAGWEKRAQA